MKLKYFKYNNLTTAKDIENQYRELAKKYHPDTNNVQASNEAFQEMIQEKEIILKKLKKKAEFWHDEQTQLYIELLLQQINKIYDQLPEIIVNKIKINEKYKPDILSGISAILNIVDKKYNIKEKLLKNKN